MDTNAPHQQDPIGGCFAVDLTRPLPGAGGGLDAFGVTDLRSGRTDLMAVAVLPGAPARFDIMRDLTEGCAGLLGPLGFGPGPRPDGTHGLYTICPAPPGPPVSLHLKPWTEAALIAQVLRPAAQVLTHLATKGVTHRAIRANNVFAAGPGQKITLGAGWSAPPAMHQPGAYEPFYSLMCDPAGRGNGSIADDVYALGCLLVALAAGAEPMAGLDDAAVLRRKLDLGSFAALTGGVRLPPLITDLVRGMLAEDPVHRPTPAMLLDPAATRGRRVATRPSRRAQRALNIGGVSVWDARGLAVAFGQEPEAATRALRDGQITHWLRRGLADATLCARVEELVRHRGAEPADARAADTMLGMRVVAAAEPLAPICWGGLAFWPDGLGPVLAAHAAESACLALLEEAVIAEAPSIWASMREDHGDSFAIRTGARANRALLRVRAPAGGMRRLVYALNPLLPCGGVLGAAHCVPSIATIAPAMEAVARDGGHPFDADTLAFIAARSGRSLDMEAFILATTQDGPLAWLRILAEIQARHPIGPLPALARYAVAQSGPLLTRWHNRDQRRAVTAELAIRAEAGFCAPMIALLDDRPGLEADALGVLEAVTARANLDAALAAIAQGAEARVLAAEQYGQEIAAGLGLTALAGTLLATVLG